MAETERDAEDTNNKAIFFGAVTNLRLQFLECAATTPHICLISDFCKLQSMGSQKESSSGVF